MKKWLYIFLLIAISLLLLGANLFFNNNNNSTYTIDETHQAKQISPRITFIVLHFTHGDFKDSLDVLTNGKLSAHYLIPEGPIDDQNLIYRLVPDSQKAAHAGLSYWQGQDPSGQINLNASSIGIELVNEGFKDENNVRTWYPFADYQIDLLIKLLKDLIEKYDIEPTRIIGHGEITPNIAARGTNTRIDPGPLFPWEKLADAGIGAWYDRDAVEAMLKNNTNEEINILWLQDNLAKYGYNIQPTGILDDQTRNVVRAFQMHFRPSNYSGIPDRETCAILKSLMERYF
jgi:N-acetylmuramoyl-L-alanine amidase